MYWGTCFSKVLQLSQYRVSTCSIVSFSNVEKHAGIYVTWKLGFLIVDFSPSKYSCTHLHMNRNIWGWVKWAIESFSEKGVIARHNYFLRTIWAAFIIQSFCKIESNNQSSSVFYCLWIACQNANSQSLWGQNCSDSSLL